MNKQKRYLLLAIVIFSVAILTYFMILKNAPKEDVTLEFGMFVGSNWDVANANSYVIIDKVIKKFEDEHPGVKVHYVSGIRKVDYSEWYAQQVLQGKTPDVAMILSDDFEKMASLGVLENLEELSVKDQEFAEDKFFRTALAAGKYKNSQYALPYETVPMLMFVNKSLLNHEGIMVPESDWTWDDLYEISQKITKDTDRDGIIDQFGSCNYTWKEAAYANGVTMFDDGGEGSYFTDQRIVEAVKFAKKLTDLNQKQKATQDDFDAGKVGFMPLSFADYRTYKTYPYKIKKFSSFMWDCITMPAGEQGDNLSEVDTLMMGISSQSKHKELAWELLKMFTYNEDTQMDIFRYSQGASVLKAVTSSKQAETILSQDVDDRERVIDNIVLSEVIDKGIILPQFPKYHEAMVYTEGEIDKVLSEDKNVESSMKIIQRNVTTMLKQ